jgi:hypothetical protein
MFRVYVTTVPRELKDIAEIMRHAELTYIQTMDAAKRTAVEKIATELARFLRWVKNQ